MKSFIIHFGISRNHFYNAKIICKNQFGYVSIGGYDTFDECLEAAVKYCFTNFFL